MRENLGYNNVKYNKLDFYDHGYIETGYDEHIYLNWTNSFKHRLAWLEQTSVRTNLDVTELFVIIEFNYTQLFI